MDYKKIIKSRNLRVRILSKLAWVPDRIMILLQYWIHTGRKLNLKNPERFTEKIQLYKLNYRNSEMLRCTDKFTVRDFVKEKGLEDILIPLIGIYSSPNEINFDSLPNKFVAKTTDGGGGNQIFICRDKACIDRDKFFQTLNGWMAVPKVKKTGGREWAYENGHPRRILIEDLLSNPGHVDLPDYKFFCFDGKPVYCQVISGRFIEETIDFYDMDWNRMPFRGLNPACGPAAKPAAMPHHFEKLKEVASKLAKDFPFSRIDLYDTKSQVWFGEVTFYPASGYGVFTPDEWDEKLGDLMILKSLSPTHESGLTAMGGGKCLLINNITLTISEFSHSSSLIDYKFFCFDGEVGFIYGISDREPGKGAKFGIYTKDWKKLDVVRNDELPQDKTLPIPINFEKMIEVAETLSNGFPEVRVDLYNINGKIYFGELTFYDGSGYMSFTPDSFDFELGSLFCIDSFAKNRQS